MRKCGKILIWILVLALMMAAMTACNRKDDLAETKETVETEPQIRGAFPATKPALVVKSAKANAGDKNVEVVIEVVNNPGILGMDYDLYYDDSVMTLVNTKSELTLDGCTYTPPAYYKSPTTFLWDFQDGNWTEDGAVVKLYFDIADDAPVGKYEIKIMYSYGNIFDANFNPIDVGVKNGKISIS